MSVYVLTPAAAADLAGIASYIALDDPAMADRVVVALDAAMRRLARFPLIGHLRMDLDREPLRVWVQFSYLIVYRPEARPLEVVRIVHGARELAKQLGKPPRKRRRRGAE